jgi:hypothetical protein
MKRWTNGLPGATMRLGAKMAQRGLSVSQPRMRADTHVGPELNAPLQRPDTLMQLSRSSFSEIRLVKRGRAIHIGTFLPDRPGWRRLFLRVKRTSQLRTQTSEFDPNETLDAWKEGCSTLPGRAGTSNAFSAAYGSRTVSVDLEQT